MEPFHILNAYVSKIMQVTAYKLYLKNSEE